MRHSWIAHAMFGVAAAVSCSGIAGGQIIRQTAVGLVLSAGSASVVPANSETPLAAKAGELLFAGDRLLTTAPGATFLFCPGKSVITLAGSSDALLEPAKVKMRQGSIAGQRAASSCFLPEVARVANASLQHYGASMVRGLLDGDTAKPVEAGQLPPEVAAELAPLDAALAGNAKDISARVARTVVFEKYKLHANALGEYRRIAADFPDATWVRGKIFELEETLTVAAAATTPTEGGQIYAVLIGISQYQKLPKTLWLQYANQDAVQFAQHLQSPRGGGTPKANVLLLTDEAATTAAIRNAFHTFLQARAGKKDLVIVSIAAHGIVQSPGNKGAYILTYDTDPQDLAATALPMEEIQEMLQQGLGKAGRVALFVDVCRAGSIGSIQSTAVNSAVERLGEAEGDVFGFMASRPRELSHEGAQFGGGHGAFTYYVLKALSGAADGNSDGKVDVNEVIEFVRLSVAKATADKQHPRDFGNFGNDVPLSDTTKPGIPISRWPVLEDATGPRYFAAAPLQSLKSDAAGLLGRFEGDLKSGRILPSAPDSAFRHLRALQQALPAPAYLTQVNRLRVALENRGQQVLLRYLEGDQIPQQRTDFESGARDFEAALSLTPESVYLQARADFCQGRAMLFDKRYREAAELLERSVRFDPSGAYAYNALGIAYLEQANYARASAAFRDAVRRAPHWAYPLHNLALASAEAGDYGNAEKFYRQALRLTPQFGYLHYNLGLLYQRLNRRAEAEAAYRQALAVSPRLADAYNGLGTLSALNGKRSEAEEQYRNALQIDPGLLAARQNLALLLSARQDRASEALSLWRDNLQRDPEFLASRVSLASFLASHGDPSAAADEYAQVLKLRPDYVAARVALADLEAKTGASDAALENLQQALDAAPQNVEILERIGDLRSRRENAAAARAAWNEALRHATDGAAKKRLRKKLEHGQ